MKKMSFCVLLLLLNACAVGPNYQRPEFEIPNQYKEAPDGWKFAEPCDACALANWWEMFNDPILNNLEERVIISNENIKLAIAQFEQAQALVTQARAAYFPTVGVSGSVTRQKSSTSSNSSTVDLSSSGTSSSDTTSFSKNGAPFTNYNVGLNASWVPDLWGAVRRAVEANVAGMQASEAQIGAATLLAQASLAQYYFELRGLDGDQVILDETVKNYKKLLEITVNKYRSGTASRGDVLQAKSQVESAEVQAINNGILRAQYEHAIAVLVGTLPVNLCITPEHYVFHLPCVPLSVPSTLLERRPDIAQAERLVAQANAEIGVAIAAYFPTLTLTGADGYNSNSFPKLFTTPSQFWSLGLMLAETLFDGGLRSGQVAAARAVLSQTVAQYRQTVLSAFQNVEDNLASVRILGVESEKQNELVNTSKEALEVVLNEYKAGTVAFSNVLTAELTFFNAQKGANDINYQQMVATVNLIAALGGGW